MIVSSHDGLDEISLSAPSQISELKDGHIRTYDITPEELGLCRSELGEIMGGSARSMRKLLDECSAGKNRGLIGILSRPTQEHVFM